MKTALIIAVVVIVVAAVAGYMFLSGGAPSVQLPTAEQTGATASTGSGTAVDELVVDEQAAADTSTEAETAVEDIATEIGAADNLELPGIQ